MGIFNSVSAIRTEASLLAYLSATDITVVPYALIDKYIWRTYEDLYWEIENDNQGFFGRIGYIDSIADTDNYTISASLLSSDGYNPLYSVWVKESSTAEYYKADPITINDIKLSSQTFEWNNPKYYLYGDKIYVKPIPTGAVTSAMKVYFTPNPLVLSADTKEHNLPSGFDDVMIKSATHKIYRQLQDFDNANVYLEEYGRLKQLHMERLNKRSKQTRISMRDVRYINQ